MNHALQKSPTETNRNSPQRAKGAKVAGFLLWDEWRNHPPPKNEARILISVNHGIPWIGMATSFNLMDYEVSRP